MYVFLSLRRNYQAAFPRIAMAELSDINTILWIGALFIKFWEYTITDFHIWEIIVSRFRTDLLPWNTGSTENRQIFVLNFMHFSKSIIQYPPGNIQLYNVRWTKRKWKYNYQERYIMIMLLSTSGEDKDFYYWRTYGLATFRHYRHVWTTQSPLK